MAKQEQQIDKGLDTSVIPEPKKSALNPKVLLIGLPIFVIQLVVVYFITANILLSKIQNSNQPAGQVTEAAAENGEGQSGEGGSTSAKADTVEIGKYLHSMKDIIVNPAGTNGSRYLLVDISLDFPSNEQMEKFKTKEILAKDVIISTLSSKSLMQLNNVIYKEDSLKHELINKLVNRIPNTKINNVLFSRYIVQ